ncbi:putative membrane protein [Lactobacillus plantarum ZJ316] [Lactiplantibacillus mudanjiangensis]|nr:ABC transporter permease [Lactiplantibacillus mudanjiangensis]VDG31063.1 putative membrane protein [Lactobacillus plantarum ZJ316] [Lactiplantibacillus mudanjiangensis]
MLTVFKRKSIWLAILVGTILIGLFAFAQVGARSSVKIRHLPVALVVADHGTQAKKVAHQLRRTNSESDAKIKWITVKKTADLTDGFANSRYYGALVIHNGFSADLQR